MTSHEGHAAVLDRRLLFALAICCVGPMLLIVILASVVGVALGWATALTLGLVAAGVCIAMMAQRHRRHRSVGKALKR